MNLNLLEFAKASDALMGITVVAKLLETRDSMRNLYGDRWPAKKAEVMPLIQAVMNRDRCGELVAATKLARNAINEGCGMVAAIILGTAVDLVENRKAVAA